MVDLFAMMTHVKFLAILRGDKGFLLW